MIRTLSIVLCAICMLASSVFANTAEEELELVADVTIGQFDSDSSAINEKLYQQLIDEWNKLSGQEVYIKVFSHTDKSGTEDHNRNLAINRFGAVSDALKEISGKSIKCLELKLMLYKEGVNEIDRRMVRVEFWSPKKVAEKPTLMRDDDIAAIIGSREGETVVIDSAPTFDSIIETQMEFEALKADLEKSANDNAIAFVHLRQLLKALVAVWALVLLIIGLLIFFVYGRMKKGFAKISEEDRESWPKCTDDLDFEAGEIPDKRKKTKPQAVDLGDISVEGIKTQTEDLGSISVECIKTEEEDIGIVPAVQVEITDPVQDVGEIPDTESGTNILSFDIHEISDMADGFEPPEKPAQGEDFREDMILSPEEDLTRYFPATNKEWFFVRQGEETWKVLCRYTRDSMGDEHFHAPYDKDMSRSEIYEQNRGDFKIALNNWFSELGTSLKFKELLKEKIVVRIH